MHFLVVLLALQGVAAAQRSGGTAGGGGWSGGASGGGTGVAIPSGSDPGGASGSDAWPGLIALGAGGALLAGFLAFPRRRRGSVHARCDVRIATVCVVLDRDGRERVQGELADLARAANSDSRAGRATLIHEVSLLLRRAPATWAYGSLETAPPATRRDARRAFDRLVHDARVMFDVDRIRNIDGDLIEHRAAIDEPVRGLLAVTILIATRAPLFDASEVDRTSLAAALAWLGNALPDDLLAAQVVWTPADEDEPLDSRMLELRMPHGALTRLAGATVGTVACAHCGTRYAAEAEHCPHCGSHVAESIRSPAA